MTSPTRPEAPPAASPRPWRGRLLLLAGVVLLGLSLRHAVTAVPPLLATIDADLGLGSVGATVLGMLPTIAFGLAGFVAPLVIRRLGLVQTALLALGLGAAATVARVLIDDASVFIALGALALFGMGMGNVVGPPLVKRYFPDRQAVAMSLLVLTMQGGATLPAMLSTPLADAAGWRFSVGVWGGLMVVAALPWLAALLGDRRRADKAETPAPAPAATAAWGLAALLRSPISAGAALFYGMAALNIYAMLAWLPTILASLGLDQGQAAAMYSIYTFVTLPMALITPMIASRLKNPLPFGLLLSVVSALGYLGILFAPLSSVAVWTFLAGVGGGAFPFAMTLFNLRTRTDAGSATVTGFAMGCGYALGTVGPLLGGLLSNLSGGWTLPMLVFALTALPMAMGAVLLTRPVKFEDAG